MVKTRGLLSAMGRLGYRVVNVGERELRLGYDSFTELIGQPPFELLSANIVRQDTQQPIFKPWVVVDAPAPSGGATRRVGVIGVARFNPIFRKPGPAGSELAILHPVEPVKRAVSALREQGIDLIVLLAALHRDDAARIVNEVPEIDFVVGSYGGHYTSGQDSAGKAWLLYSGNQGKRFGETRVVRGADGAWVQQTRMHLLNAMYPSNQEMLDFVNSVVAQEAEAGERAVAAVGSGSTRGPYIGAQACQPCHEAAFEQWQATAHARSFDTLVQGGHGGERPCLACHTTAAGLAGGFISAEATPALAAVGCESCHGAGSRHLADPERQYGQVGLSSCTVCHDAKNSPGFDYYERVGRVNHRAAR